MREEFISRRIYKDTKVCDEKEKKEILKNKKLVDASSLSCFPNLMYDPKVPLSSFFIFELDLKEKLINQK